MKTRAPQRLSMSIRVPANPQTPRPGLARGPLRSAERARLLPYGPDLCDGLDGPRQRLAFGAMGARVSATKGGADGRPPPSASCRDLAGRLHGRGLDHHDPDCKRTADDLAELEEVDREAIAALLALWRTYDPPDANSRWNLRQIVGLMRGCRRRAVVAARRQVLRQLTSGPSRHIPNWICAGRAADDHVERALALCQLLAETRPAPWRRLESRLLTALSPAYTYRTCDLGEPPLSAVYHFLQQQQELGSAADVAVALERWTAFSRNLSAFDRKWVGLLVAWKPHHWAHFASVAQNSRPEAYARDDGFRYHEAMMERLVSEQDMPAHRHLIGRVAGLQSSTSERLHCLEAYLALPSDVADDGLDFVTEKFAKEDSVSALLRNWGTIDAAWRRYLWTLPLASMPGGTFLVEQVATIQKASDSSQVRLREAIDAAMQQVGAEALARGPLTALIIWHRMREEGLAWEKVNLLGDFSAAAISAFAQHEVDIPSGVLRQAWECCKAQEETEQDDSYYATQYNDDAILAACCQAYILGRAWRP